MQIYEYFFLQVEIQQRSEQREKSISNYRVQQLLGRNPLEAGKILYSLVSKNMLVSTNKGRWTSYSINADYSQGVKPRTALLRNTERKNKRFKNLFRPFYRTNLRQITEQINAELPNLQDIAFQICLVGCLKQPNSGKVKSLFFFIK